MKVAIYARVSSRQQAERELPIEGQLSVLREFATQEEWTVAREYVDPGISGRIAERPAFQRMIADARKKRRPFKGVLIWKLNRFSRDVADSIAFERELKNCGVRVYSYCERGLDDSASGTLSKNVLRALNQYTSDAISEDVRRGLEANFRRGGWNNGTPPYGYRIERDAQGCPRLVPHPEEAPILQRMFHMARDGMTARAIARALNAEGIRTRKGLKWIAEPINKILRSEAYLGTLVSTYGKKPDNHEPLVDRETWDAVRAIVATRRPEWMCLHPRTVNSQYLFSGLAYCGLCGHPMRGRGSGGRPRYYHYYICANRRSHGVTACDAPLLRRSIVEAEVLRQIQDLLIDEASLKSIVAETNRELLTARDEKDIERKALEKELKRVLHKRENVVNAIEEGIRDESVKKRLQALSGRAVGLERRHQELSRQEGDRPQPLTVGEVVAYVSNLQKVLQGKPAPLRKELMRALIKRVWLTKEKVELELHLEKNGAGTMQSATGAAASIDPELKLVFLLEGMG